MRLTIADEYEQAIKKISGGNPGALSVLMQCYEKDFFVGQLVTANLDEKGIYDGHIWVLYKDKCGEDLDKFIAELDPRIIDTADKIKGLFK